MVGSALIAGAGIAGLAVANSLSRSGVEVTVVEINDQLLPRGLGLALQPNAVKAIELLGLGSELDRRAVGFDKAVSATADGTPVFEVPFPRSADDRASMYGIHRNELLQLLTTGSSANIELGVTIDSLVDDGQGVTVALTDGTERRVDAVIGADGPNSVVRSMSFDATVESRSYVAWRALVPIEPQDPTDSILRAGPESFFGTFPVTERDMYFFGLRHVPAGEQADPGLTGLVEVAARFDSFCRDLAGRVSNEELIFVPVREVHCPRWVKGRTVLVGDAAHAIVPFLAQGAALALEDAVTLADSLLGSDPIEGLTSWERTRQARVEWVRGLCRSNGIRVGLEGTQAATSLDSDAIQKAMTEVPAIYQWPVAE